MIQRIQSLYLLLLVALGAVLFFTGEHLALIISVLAIVIPALSFFTIFLFSKRKIQVRLTEAIITLTIIFICATCYYTFNGISESNVSFGLWINLIIPVLQLLLAVFAYHGIKRDDNLVKSYDRLR